MVGLADSFGALLAARLLFGLGFAATWTAGVTLLASPSGARSAIGGTVTVGGIAHLVGPPLSGVLSDAVGRTLPFLLLAAAAAVVTRRAARRLARRRPTGRRGPGCGPRRAPPEASRCCAARSC